MVIGTFDSVIKIILTFWSKSQWCCFLTKWLLLKVIFTNQFTLYYLILNDLIYKKIIKIISRSDEALDLGEALSFCQLEEEGKLISLEVLSSLKNVVNSRCLKLNGKNLRSICKYLFYAIFFLIVKWLNLLLKPCTTVKLQWN